MRLFRELFKKHYEKTFSQCGEDVIVSFILNCIRIKKPTYLDIGAHHPTYLSNTAFFYKKGLTGVCVEPDPTLFGVIKAQRTKDVCLNVGIGVTDQSEADFYMMSAKSLNTFSKEGAEALATTSQKIKKIIKVPLVPVNSIIDKYCKGFPNFVSLDVEGLELDILKTFDFDRFRPQVFCIETLTYTEDNSEQKETDIIEYMVSKDYLVYADTYINTIFVDRSSWVNR